MATITIQVEDDLARRMEESARRAHQSVSEWVREHIKPAVDRSVIDDELVACETYLGLDDFPQFPGAMQNQARLSRDVIYDERGR